MAVLMRQASLHFLARMALRAFGRKCQKTHSHHRPHRRRIILKGVWRKLLRENSHTTVLAMRHCSTDKQPTANQPAIASIFVEGRRTWTQIVVYTLNQCRHWGRELKWETVTKHKMNWLAHDVVLHQVSCFPAMLSFQAHTYVASFFTPRDSLSFL